MKKFWTLFRYEIYKLMVSPSTYVIFAIFSALNGLIFFALLREYAKIEQDIPFTQMFFRCFWLPTCATVPLITMRSLADEYKEGTLQNLFSTTISNTTVVLAKFSAIYLEFVVLWLSSLLMFIAVGSEQWSILRDTAFVSGYNLFGGMTFILVTGLLFVAIGIFASSLSENSIVSGMAAFFMLIAIFVGGQILATNEKFSSFSTITTFKESLSIFWQLDNFCCGVIDSRIIVFNVTLCALFLCLSGIAIKRKFN